MYPFNSFMACIFQGKSILSQGSWSHTVQYIQPADRWIDEWQVIFDKQQGWEVAGRNEIKTQLKCQDWGHILMGNSFFHRVFFFPKMSWCQSVLLVLSVTEAKQLNLIGWMSFWGGSGWSNVICLLKTRKQRENRWVELWRSWVEQFVIFFFFNPTALGRFWFKDTEGIKVKCQSSTSVWTCPVTLSLVSTPQNYKGIMLAGGQEKFFTRHHVRPWRYCGSSLHVKRYWQN